MKLTVTNPTPSSGYSNLPSFTPIIVVLSEFSKLVNNIQQSQGTLLNLQPEVSNVGLRNGDYSYTSSFFSTSGTISNVNNAVGTTQFG